MRDRLPWLRIFVEGVVIVVSVLLALGADAWWDGVQDRRLETRYYERLLEDLARDSLTLERILHFNSVYRTAALEVIGVLEGAAPSSPDELKENAHRVAWAGFLSTDGLYSSVFDEMVSSGHLGLIDDRDLSAALAYYDGSQRRRESIFQRAPEEFSGLARRSLPAGFTRGAQQCIWEEWVGLGAGGKGRCRVEIGHAEAARVMSQLRSEPTTIGYLREVVWFTDDVHSAFSDHQLRNTLLAERVRRTLAGM